MQKGAFRGAIGVFISHVEEDAAVALQLAAGLEEAGFSTWCYELDAVPGPSHMDQTLNAIENCDALVLLISPNCVHSHEVTTELTRAQDHHKHIIPLLYDISHKQLVTQRAEWVERLGTAMCLPVSKDIIPVVSRVVAGLKSFEVVPASVTNEERVRLLKAEIERYKEEPVTDVPNAASHSFFGTVSNHRMGTKSFQFPGHAQHADDVADFVKGLLEAESLETQIVKDGRKRIVQGKASSQRAWMTNLVKNSLGLDKAVSIVIAPSADFLEVTIGAGKWMDKAIGGAIGAAVFWPLLVTAGWGVYKQQLLFSQVGRNIETFLRAKK